MAITLRFTGTSARQATFEASRGVTTVGLTATLPGTIHVTTTGDQMLTVGHVPYYVDLIATVDANHRIRFERTHVTYRYGDHSDRVPYEDLQAVLAFVTDAVTALVHVHGSAIGFIRDKDTGAEVRLAEDRLNSTVRAIAEKTAQLTQLDKQLATAAARRDAAVRTLASLEDARAEQQRALDRARTAALADESATRAS